MNKQDLKDYLETVRKDYRTNTLSSYNTTLGILQYDAYCLAVEVYQEKADIYTIHEYIESLELAELDRDYINQEKEACHFHELVIVNDSATYYI